jgi:capsule polysaccharide export protein KpsE/RkpR
MSIPNNRSKEITLHDDEIDLKELIDVIWKKKILIILVTLAFALSSILFSLSLTNLYKSEALLTVNLGSNANSSSGGLGSLASSIGFNMPANVGDKGILAIETVQSRDFLKHLITFENVLPSIMAARGYDRGSKKIQFDPEIYNESNGQWVRPPKNNRKSTPSHIEAHGSYLGQMSIVRNQETSNISISVEHVSPIFAKEFLELIINESNELLRNKDLRESNDAIAYLNSEIPKASLISMKEAINKLVLSKLETQMMAKISTEYVLKTIEPPFIPEIKSSPNRALICILSTFFGGMIAIFWVLMRHYVLGRVK